MSVIDCFPLVAVMLLSAFWAFAVGNTAGFYRGWDARDREVQRNRNQLEDFRGGDK